MTIAAPRPDIRLEPVAAGDIEELVRIRTLAMRDSLVRVGRFDPDRVRARLVNGFAPDHTRHVALDGRRIGFVAMIPEADAMKLDHFYLLPASQGSGVGSDVMRRLIAEADALGLPIRLGALRGSAANRFYQRHGFVQIGEDAWDIYYSRPVSNDASRPLT